MAAPMVRTWLLNTRIQRLSRANVANGRLVCCTRRLCTSAPEKTGVVLGVYEKEEKDGEGVIFTPSSEQFNEKTSGKLLELLQISGSTLKKGKTRIFYGVDKEYPSVAVVGLGKQSAGINELEEINESKENIRTAASVGARQLREVGIKHIEIDPCTDAQAAAEGATLGLFSYDELKQESKQKPKVNLGLHGNKDSLDKWQKGMIIADCQNFARKLTEMPANKLTPTDFANLTVNRLQDLKNVETIVRSKDWIVDQKMGAFLSIAQGSVQPPIFMEIKYTGSKDKNAKPIVLVGKGVTFDCGGISIKPSAQMDEMRGDMGGAAVVTGTMAAIATLQLPINVVCLIPLCENLVSGEAVKPGDVAMAMNGKTIQVDNTDAEGRLLLADALHYGCTVHTPASIINVATLTGAMMVSLGSGAAGVFSNSASLWANLHKAGIQSGERLWRMPLFQHYTAQITKSQLADVNNIGNAGSAGGSCTAAAFLREFVSCDEWAHIDMAGVVLNKSEVPYLGKGMTGRPTRTLIEFLSNI